MKTQPKIAFITVLYATAPSCSETVKSLSKYADNSLPLIFWDNSSNSAFKDEIKRMFGSNAVYLSSDRNERLSVVYNSCVDAFPADIYVFLDDDSAFDQNYVCDVLEFFNRAEDIYCPRIKNKELLISPGLLRGVRGHRLKQECLDKDLSRAIITAMMSGVAVKSHVLKRVRFNEKLKFYGVDTKFFIDCYYSQIRVYVGKFEIGHHSALRNFSSQDQHVRRVRMLLDSKRVVFDHLPFFRIRVAIYCIMSILKIIVERRSLGYARLLPSVFDSLFKHGPL